MEKFRKIPFTQLQTYAEQAEQFNNTQPSRLLLLAVKNTNQ